MRDNLMKKKSQKPDLPETDGENSHVIVLRLQGAFQLSECTTGSVHEPATEGKKDGVPVVQIGYTPLGSAERVMLTAEFDQGGLDGHWSHVAHAVITEELIRSHAPAFQIPLHISLLQPGEQSEARPSTITAQLFMDITKLVLGEMECACQWSLSFSDHPIPADLALYIASARVTVKCCEYIQPESVDDPLEAKDPHAFLPPVLVEQLAPIALQFTRAVDLPDMPASSENLDTGCYRCCLRFRLPSQEQWHSISAVTLGDWSAPQDPLDVKDTCDPPLRKRCLGFAQAFVIFSCDLDLPNFIDACISEPLVVEIHDRDAKPVELVIAMPKELFSEPAPPPQPVQEPVQPIKGNRKGNPDSKQAEPEPEPAAEAKEPEPEFAPLAAEYVCGRVQLHLAPLARGLTALQFEQSIQPYSTVRATDGLDWRQRPGVYMHAQSRLKASIRCSRPLPGLKADRPMPFSRALFIMDRADSVMFHVIEDCVRLHNAHVLGLLPDTQEAIDFQDGHTASDATQPCARQSLGEDASDEEQMERLPEMLQKHLDRCDYLTPEVLQSLSTHQLEENAATDTSLDIFTGFHLVDGKQRIIIVEGLADQAMQALIVEVSEWALTSKNSLPEGEPRHVLFNRALHYSERLYHSLGVNLWILKTRGTLKRILRTPSTFTRGQVQPACKEGLRRLGCLQGLQWARQLHNLALWPTALHLSLLDRKFGGALTRADTLGMDAAECDEADGGEHGPQLPTFVLLDADAPPQRQLGGAGTMSTARSRHSMRAPAKVEKKRYRPLTRPPVDMQNVDFELRRLEASARRSQRNLTELLKEAEGVIGERQAAAAAHRHAWQEWNPQRDALRQLCEQIVRGEVSLSEVEHLRRERLTMHEPQPGTIPPEQAHKLGWYPHPQKFSWPSPKEPLELRRHPKRPHELRIEQLQEAWDEGALHLALQVRVPSDGTVDFDTSCAMQPPALFNKDPSFEKSVFIPDGGEDGMAEQEYQLKEAELREWMSKVVVEDTTFHTGGPRPHKPGQMDRSRNMLHGEPRKLSLRKTFVPAAPISMFLRECDSAKQVVPDSEASRAPSAGWKSREHGFKHILAKDKREIHKLGFNQSWYAGLRDELE